MVPVNRKKKAQWIGAFPGAPVHRRSAGVQARERAFWVRADKTIQANEPESLLFQNIIKSFIPFKCNILLPGPLKNLDNPVKGFTKIFS